VARCHSQQASGDIDPAELAAAIAAADRAGGNYWPIMMRYDTCVRTRTDVVESTTTDALRLAESIGFQYFADNLLRTQLAIVAQFRDDSARVLAVWRALVPSLDKYAVRRSDSLVFYSLAEGEHADPAVGLHLAEHYALSYVEDPYDPITVARMHAVIAHLRRLQGDLTGAESALEAFGRCPPSNDSVGALGTITRSALLRQRGQAVGAAAAIEPAVRLAVWHGVTDIPMRVTEELAAVGLALGRHQDAANLLATATHDRHHRHRPLSPACQPEIENLRTALGNTVGTALDHEAVTHLAKSMAHSD
jgi:hypothetical protein